ncbi:SAM-dependent methyltransferase [Bacillus carboniphilus]|uniref:SAM-dependent methyltransferase n=1 Tax=Bacillus carboniphilus TaxID=86663 RepID=A0ABY9K273_9BACI|nr:SAM-dependent methyltransferase [Bacillus carboniphilus]WLR43925.1 SAM-dependent methyltransferase [Bacillus carboniphilus]
MKQIILDEIKKYGGKISFAKYMELCLYHETFGYYTKEQEKIGKSGDYVTSSVLSSIFAEMIAEYYVYLVIEHHIQPAFCEIGAGNGAFFKEFKEWLKKISEEIYEKSMFIAIEKSPHHQLQFKKATQYSVQVKRELPNKFSGMIFSNEWLDALPVHVVTRKEGQLFEVFITSQEEQLKEVLIPLENQRIEKIIENYQTPILEGHRIELSLKMLDELYRVNLAVDHGILMTIDYGYEHRDLYDSSLKDGSLRGYKNHQMITNLLDEPFSHDITSHILIDLYKKKARTFRVE